MNAKIDVRERSHMATWRSPLFIDSGNLSVLLIRLRGAAGPQGFQVDAIEAVVFSAVVAMDVDLTLLLDDLQQFILVQAGQGVEAALLGTAALEADVGGVKQANLLLVIESVQYLFRLHISDLHKLFPGEATARDIFLPLN